MTAKREVPLTLEEKRARNRAYRHKANHKKNNMTARAHNRAARLAAQWVQAEHPAKWDALVVEARRIEENNDAKFVPHSVRFAGAQCPHTNLQAIGITARCTDCGEIIGSIPVSKEGREMLQDILDDNDLAA